MDIAIRKATLEDVDSIVYNRMDFMYQVTGDQQTDEFRNATRTYLYDHINDNSMLCYIATQKDRIIASVIVCFYHVIPKRSNMTGKVGYVFNVYTLKEFRGQGLATKLLNNVIEQAKQQGVGELYLSATEEGKKLYEKLQFQYLNNEMRLRLQ